MHPEIQQHPKIIASDVAGARSDINLQPTYFTVAQFSERNPAFSKPAVRNLVFKADARKSTVGTIPGNGLIESGAIVRLGRKVLIHEGRFFEWVESQGAGK